MARMTIVGLVEETSGNINGLAGSRL